jgi:quercetin dioxygenase-like cupin family protein
LILRLTDHPHGVVTGPGDHVVYDVAADEAHFGAAAVEGHALLWELVDRPTGDWLVRCDRVDFPPGGEAFPHTHQGPGIRVLLFGSIRIETQGATHSYGPGEPWFESGPDPVHAWTHASEPSAFVRCMVLPRALLGSPSIRYVREEDRERPKSQSYTVFLDEPVVL